MTVGIVLVKQFKIVVGRTDFFCIDILRKDMKPFSG